MGQTTSFTPGGRTMGDGELSFPEATERRITSQQSASMGETNTFTPGGRTRGDGDLYRSSSVAALLTGPLTGDWGDRTYHMSTTKRSQTSNLTTTDTLLLRGGRTTAPAAATTATTTTTPSSTTAALAIGEENMDTSNLIKRQAEGAATRALLEKAKLASSKLRNGSGALEAELLELKAQRARLLDAYEAAKQRAGPAAATPSKTQEEVNALQALEARLLALTREKETAQDQCAKLKQDMAMKEKLSSSSSSPGAELLEAQLHAIQQENEALSSQLRAAQLLRRQEQEERDSQPSSPAQVRKMQNAVSQLQHERDVLLRDQERLQKDKAASDAQLRALIAQVNKGGVPGALGLPPTPTSHTKPSFSSPLSAAGSSPSKVLAALNRRLKGQKTPASQQRLQQLETAVAESNQLKAELSENNRLLDLLKRKMMQDEDEADVVAMGESDDEDDEEEDEEENVVVIGKEEQQQEQEPVAARPRLSV